MIPTTVDYEIFELEMKRPQNEKLCLFCGGNYWRSQILETLLHGSLFDFIVLYEYDFIVHIFCEVLMNSSFDVHDL